MHVCSSRIGCRLTWRTRKKVLVVSHLSILARSLTRLLQRCRRAEGSFALLQKARHVDQGLLGISAMMALYMARMSTDICILTEVAITSLVIEKPSAVPIKDSRM